MVDNPNLTILQGDVVEQLRTLADESIHCVVTSPPYYGLRSYLKPDDPNKGSEIGAEKTPQAYVERVVEVFREVKRVLRNDGVCWLNLGDSYSTSKVAELSQKTKDLIGIPWRVAFALQSDGWYLRAACPWIKRNGMPESVKNRPTRTIESIFMLTKSESYFYDSNAVRVPLAESSIPRLKQNVAEQEGSVRANAGAKSNGNFKAVGDIANGRTLRSSDWFMKSWQGMLQNEEGEPLAFIVNVQPYRAAHFATFPVNLVEPMVKTSTSEKGCCFECGKPWERVINRVKSEGETADVSDKRKPLHTQMYSRHKVKTIGDRSLISGHDETVSWKQGCNCNTHTPVPCTVLDLFAGSGTTGKVALSLGRKAVLIELNAEYIPLIRERCRVDTKK